MHAIHLVSFQVDISTGKLVFGNRLLPTTLLVGFFVCVLGSAYILMWIQIQGVKKKKNSIKCFAIVIANHDKFKKNIKMFYILKNPYFLL